MKTRKIRTITFIIILFLIIGLFLYLKFKSYTYEVNYVLNSFKIEEKYNNTFNKYKFLINYNDTVYSYNFENKYIRKKELINDIEIYKNNTETCILPVSKYVTFYPLCSKNSEIVTYNLSSVEIDNYKYEKMENSNVNHDKLTINHLYSANYLLYNYKGFYYIKDNNIDNIELYKKDIYTINLVYQLNEYVIIPDYDEDHYFNKIYAINMNNGKVKNIEFEYDISFDSIFLGDYKNNIYFLDKKAKKEYKINVEKLKIEESDFLILQNSKLEKTTYKNIVNNNLLFDNKNVLSYKIIDNKLYQIVDNYKILITDKIVDKIIKEEDNTIYYLVKENLYMYNNIYGEILLMSNFEWNFNNTNMIYLYK